MTSTVTVACKLPVGFNPEFASGVIFAGTNQQGSERAGGYGITENVPEDEWADWLSTHSNFPAVERGLIFAENNTQRAVARAREAAGLASGFEPLDPDKPAPGIEPDAEAMKSGDAEQKAIAATAEAKK